MTRVDAVRLIAGHRRPDQRLVDADAAEAAFERLVAGVIAATAHG